MPGVNGEPHRRQQLPRGMFNIESAWSDMYCCRDRAATHQHRLLWSRGAREVCGRKQGYVVLCSKHPWFFAERTNPTFRRWDDRATAAQRRLYCCLLFLLDGGEAAVVHVFAHTYMGQDDSRMENVICSSVFKFATLAVQGILQKWFLLHGGNHSQPPSKICRRVQLTFVCIRSSQEEHT